MGQMVYVLTTFEGTGKHKEWRPVAVVSNPDLASQWYEYGTNVDWIPFELDDVKNISPENMPTFHPRETTPGEARAIELSKKMEATIQRMQKIIDDQEALIKKLTRGKKAGHESMLKGVNVLNISDPENPAPNPFVHNSGTAEEDTIPPKPMEGGSRPFPPTLDAQGIADYIETYAVYPVDNEFVYEKFRGSHAVLKLVPIASLREGGREQNLRSKKIEDKYLKQSLKTQPPAVVEDGEVLDGNHRLRANKRRGLTHMWCYVVMGDENGDTDANGSN
jgi:hypothetical protein